MSGHRAQLNTAMGRMAACFLMAAGLVLTFLLAPVAAATPESDADAAITAAWEATGGAAGPLGPSSGDVYGAGEGFAQNFASGAMFFTPETGAHYMQGAILDKYEALGGPADSDLGFPTIDEGPGRVGPDSRNVTFSAPDNPVIFWTPATGARVVRGPINAAWDELGGSSAALGVPAEDEVFRGDVVTQKFTGGEVSWNRKTKAFTTVPPELADQLTGLEFPDDPTSAINAARRAAGGALGPLGAKEGDEYPIAPDGVGQDFAGGKIFYTPATGANVLTGQVLEKYESVGGPEGDLGFPTSSEIDGGLGPTSRMATFAAADDPVIFWTPDYGAAIVRGPMKAAWSKLDEAEGPLGAPTGDQTESSGKITQRFSGGSITWDRSTKKFSTEPADLASQLADLEISDSQVPAQAPESADSDRGFSWNWWWLLAAIPVLALAGALVGLAVWNRRKDHDDGWDDHRFDAHRYDADHEDYEDLDDRGHDDDDHAYGAVSVTGAQQPGSDGPTARFAEPYGERPDTPGPRRAPGEPGESADLWGFRLPDSPVAMPPSAVQWAQKAQSVEPLASSEVEDPDAVDTEPTPIVADPDAVGSAVLADEAFADEALADHAYSDDAHAEEAQDDYERGRDFPSGRHAAQRSEEPMPGQTAIHLPLSDRAQAPEGYPIKADTRSGFYWSPDSPDYDDAIAELWFASEELARTNGFVEAD